MKIYVILCSKYLFCEVLLGMLETHQLLQKLLIAVAKCVCDVLFFTGVDYKQHAKIPNVPI